MLLTFANVERRLDPAQAKSQLQPSSALALPWLCSGSARFAVRSAPIAPLSLLSALSALSVCSPWRGSVVGSFIVA